MKYRKPLLFAAALVVVAAGLGWWWHHQSIYPSTNDAYLKANILTVSPQVSGRVSKVLAREAGHVGAGDTLVELNADTLNAAVAAAEAQLDLAKQSAGAGAAQVAAAEAELGVAQSAYADAETAYLRTQALFDKGDAAQAALDNASAARDQAGARVGQATAALQAARDQLGASGGNNAEVRAARAGLEQARIALGHAELTAPVPGWIANLSLRPGDVVGPGQSLFSLVEDGDWWVDANFSETDLTRIRPGQPVSLSIDMYPGLELSGKVESIGAGSGAVFSLLPPQNATGNWVKVTQRFPVRISVTPPKDPAYQLRVGASVTATVDTSGLPDKS